MYIHLKWKTVRQYWINLRRNNILMFAKAAAKVPVLFPFHICG